MKMRLWKEPSSYLILTAAYRKVDSKQTTFVSIPCAAASSKVHEDTHINTER